MNVAPHQTNSSVQGAAHGKKLTCGGLTRQAASLKPVRHYAKGEPVFHCGDPVAGLFTVRIGLVRLVHLTEEGREVTVRLAGPGDVLGPDALRPHARYSADARCMSEVALDYTSRESVLGGLNQRVSLDLLAQLGRQLASAERHVTLSTYPTDARILWLFGWLAPRFGVTHLDEHGCWTELELLLTHEDVAALVNATRVTVSYAFAQLREAGVLRGSRGRYFVKPSSLRQSVLTNTT